MIWSLSLPHDPGPRWSSPPLLLLPAGINPPITVAGERLAPQIEVFTSKPSLIQPSVREQLTSQDSPSLCAKLIRNPEEHRGGEEKHTHTHIYKRDAFPVFYHSRLSENGGDVPSELSRSQEEDSGWRCRAAASLPTRGKGNKLQLNLMTRITLDMNTLNFISNDSSSKRTIVM